jgi:hypothetical protein
MHETRPEHEVQYLSVISWSHMRHESWYLSEQAKVIYHVPVFSGQQVKPDINKLPRVGKLMFKRAQD